MTLYTGFIQLGAGLSVGLAGLSAGFAIGIVGDAGVRGVAQQSRVFVGMILILSTSPPSIIHFSKQPTNWTDEHPVFSEVLGLYGLIVALILNTRSSAHNGVRSLSPEPEQPLTNASAKYPRIKIQILCAPVSAARGFDLEFSHRLAIPPLSVITKTRLPCSPFRFARREEETRLGRDDSEWSSTRITHSSRDGRGDSKTRSNEEDRTKQ